MLLLLSLCNTSNDNNNYDIYMQPGTNQNRMYHRFAHSSGQALFIWHHDGTGMLSGNQAFENGSAAAENQQVGNGLNGSILNNDPIRIGGNPVTGNTSNARFGGDVWWVQIWQGDESTLPGGSASQFAMDVWNNGNPNPIVPETTSMSLLLIGLIGLLGFGRRRRR